PEMAGWAALDAGGEEGGPHPPPPARAGRIADNGLADVPHSSIAGELLGDLLAGGDDRLSPKLLGERLPTQRDRGPLGDGPVSLASLCLQGRLLLVVAAVGCLARHQVARGGQVARQEVLSYGALGLPGDVDLPLPQPLEELLG